VTAALAFEPTDPEYWRTPEFQAQIGLDYIYAQDAYALGLDGTGVNIGLLDTGIDMSHPEFAGRSFSGWALDGVLWSRDGNGHGTMVASVLAANRDGVGMHGVAPGARLLVASDLNSRGEFDEQALVGGVNWLIDQDTDFILYELGHTGFPVVDYTLADAHDTLGMPLLDAFRRATDAGIVVIVPTHNQFFDDPSLEAGLPSLFPELEDNWLAVSGYYYGNKCGVAKYYCLTAPAEDIRVAAAGGGYENVWGTSFAGPHVAGVAALVKQRYPYLTANQIKQVLLGTAWDENGDGVDDQFGYGLLQAWAAVRGPGKFDWGDFHVVQPSGVSSWYNAISGAGGLIKSGEGALILRADNTYTGPTRVDGGDLVIEGSIASNAFADPGGVLTGDGTIDGAVENRGTLMPGWGADGGTLTISGNYDQYADASFLVYVGGRFGVSHAAIQGAASLDGTVEARVLAGGYQGDAEHEILRADLGLTGQFEGVTDDMAFLDTQLRYDPDAAYLGVRRNGVTFTSFAGSANGAGAAGAIEALGVGNSLFDAAVTLSTADAGAAFEQLSGQEQASTATALADAGSLVGSMANDRLRSSFGSAGAVEVPIMSYADGGTPLMVSMDYRGPAFWTSSQAAWGSGDAMNRFSAGQLVGVDAPFGDWRLGALAGVGLTSTSSSTASLKGTDYHFGVYGGTSWGSLALRSGASFSHHELETSRSVTAGGLGQTLTSSYGGNTAQAFAELGYGIEAGDLHFEPFAGLAYMNVWTDGFAETGGSAALSGSGTTLSALFTTIGLNAQTRIVIGETEAVVRGSAGWRHAFGDAPVSTQAFSGSGSFAVTGSEVDRDVALLEAGVDFPISASATVGLTYGGQLSAKSHSHGFKAELRVDF